MKIPYLEKWSLGQAAGTTREMGETLDRAAQSYKTRFNELTTKLFDDRLANKIPAAARNSEMTATRDALKGFIDAFKELPGGLGAPKIMKDLQKVIDTEGGATWRMLSRSRSVIGEMLDHGFEKGNILGGEAAKLYGTLSEDMTHMAEVYKFLPQFKRSNRVYEAGRKQINEVLRSIVDVGGESGFDWVKSLASTSSGADIAKLKRLKSSLRSGPAKDAVWGDLQATAIKSLGRSANKEGREIFDAQTYLRNYGAVSEEGKTLLYGRSGPLRKAMDRLGTTFARHDAITQGQRSSLARLSGQIAPGAQTTLGSGMPTSGGGRGLANTLFGALSASGGAKLLTSPRFVNWLARFSGSARRSAGRAALDAAGNRSMDALRGAGKLAQGARSLRRLIRMEEDPTNRILLEEYARQIEASRGVPDE